MFQMAKVTVKFWCHDFYFSYYYTFLELYILLKCLKLMSHYCQGVGNLEPSCTPQINVL